MNKKSNRFLATLSALALTSAALLSTPAHAQSSDVYINEIQVSTSSFDWEFFELQGAPGTDLSSLTLVGIESDDGTTAGRIDRVISLAGQSIPADGFWLGISPTGSATYAVDGDLTIPDNSFENGTATYFLVRNFTGAPGDDLDTDNDGTLDSTPWDLVLDSINIRDDDVDDFSYGAPSIGPDGSFLPSGIYRCPDAPTGTFDGNILNFSTPDGTPGRSNRSTCGIPEIYINEIQVSTSSSDWEFFELQGEPGTDLSDLTLVGIESDAGTSANSGAIDRVISLAGQSIPADGFWLGISPTGTATYGVSGELAISDNSFENSTATYFLVRNFTAAQGDDLDADDDGVLDSMPWDLVLDAINIRDDDVGDFSYGAPSVGPDGTFLPSGTYRCPDAPDGLFEKIHKFSTPDGTPGVTNGCGGSEPLPITAIHDVQGSGPDSPLDGDVVAIEGIVVGDFQDDVGANGDLNGFFVQEEDADADTDPLTSEGIFVFDGSSTPAVDVAVGDLVRVEGEVSEFFGMTQISSSDVTVQSNGNGLPSAASPALPVASVDDFEAFEGMRVTFPQSLVITEYFNFDRFGEIVLSSERRLTPTAEFEPGPDAILAAEQNLLDRITLDDGRTGSNPDPAIHPNGAEFNLTNLFRGGDRVTDVTGVLNYSFGLYRIQPTQGANYDPDNPRTVAPDDVGGNLKVADLNVLNYFVTIDDGPDVCGPLLDQGCRGADNAEEFTRQRDKIIAALTGMDADVVGLIEIENDPDEAAVADLVDGLNDALGAGTYDYIATGPIGEDVIRVALIYRPAAVWPLGSHAILDSSVDARFLDDLNRPALAQSFMDASTGGIFTVVVNHLKSKGSPCDDLGDPDVGDGAGNCNVTRTNAAEALVDWLATDPTGSGVDNFLIVGDLNSYDKEDPIDAIVAGGYVDLVHSFLGEDAYGYVFNGQIGYLDHALASAALNEGVTGTTIWHINADEPDLIDYDTSFKRPNQDAIYAPDAYRSSDHDPVIVGLDICEETAPTFETLSATPNVLWPANHKYVDSTATVVVSDNFDPDPTVTLVSVTSNEPDNGKGDGNTTDDIVIVDDFNFKLRAERSGGGSGRVYTITYMVTDDCGNSATASATVTVPKSQAKKKKEKRR